jgi:hypothetical protein
MNIFSAKDAKDAKKIWGGGIGTGHHRTGGAGSIFDTLYKNGR